MVGRIQNVKQDAERPAVDFGVVAPCGPDDLRSYERKKNKVRKKKNEYEQEN